MSEEPERKNALHSSSEQVAFPLLQQSIPSLHFLNSIPSQAQRGFKNINISFSCLDICEEFFAIGTSVGIVYLYNRKKKKLHKLRNNDYTNSITCVKLLVSLECLVAVGTQKGPVFAFKVPFQEDCEIEKFKVEGLHNTSVTALEWAKNGIKFFSGDLRGAVVCTVIDHLEHESRSHIVLEEDSSIVQLSYANLFLLVSTYQRSLLHNLQQNKSCQIGQKERKLLGRFGAMQYQDKNEPFLYACRPGQRLWKSDYDGIIIETIVLKADANGANSSKDFQFGPLKMYNGQFLLTWSSEKIALIDPKAKAIKYIWNAKQVADIACHNEEIIVLQGIRNVVRFAPHPEAEENVPFKDADVTQDMKALHLNGAKENEPNHSDVFEPPKVFDWIKRKFSEVSGLQDESASNAIKVNRSNTIDVLPSVVELGLDCPQVKVDIKFTEPDKNVDVMEKSSEGVYDEDSVQLLKTSAPCITATAYDAYDDDIVYKPKKRKKKKKVLLASQESAVLTISSKSTDKHVISDATIISPVDQANTQNTDLSTTDSLSNAKEGSVSDVLQGENEKMFRCENEETTLDSVDSAKEHSESVSKEEEGSVLLTKVVSDGCAESKAFEPITSVKCNTNCEPTGNDIEESQIPIDIYSGSRSHNESKTATATEKFISPHPVHESRNTLAASHEKCHLDSPKYGVECVQYTAPGPLVSLSASNHHMFCIDSHNFVYLSNFSDFGFKWIKLSQLGEQIAVSPSEHIIYILYKEIIYAAEKQSSLEWWKPRSVKWVPIAHSISYIAVDDTCSWYISLDGHLFTNQHLTSVRPYSYPERVQSPGNLIKVAYKEGVVWVLTADERIFCKTTGDCSSEEDAKWELMTFPSELILSMFAFGGKKEAYLLSCDGTLWFRLGITPLTPHGINSTMQVESSLYVYESEGQIRKVVNKVINSELLSNILYRQRQGILASSDVGVWWCKYLDTALYCYQKHIIGHSWDMIVPKGTLTSTQWQMISAEGFSNSQGILWGADVTGELLCFSLKSSHSIAVDLPVSSVLKHVQSTPHGMWILSSEGDVFIRREISDRCPQGVWWQQLDTSQMCGVTFCHISCSAESVWSCDTNGCVYVRIGTLNPPSGGFLSQVWIQVDPEIKPPTFLAQKVYVGPRNFMVWAIDTQGSVYARSKINMKYPLGEQWIFVPSPRAKQLCISRTGVWLLKNSGKIFRRFGINKSNATGDYWKQMPGHLSYLSVTEDDDLWGVQESSLYCHYSYTLKFDSQSECAVNSEDVSEDDWEDLAAHSHTPDIGC